MAYVTFSVRDYSDEYGKFRCFVAEPAGGDLISTHETKQTALQTAIGNVILGNIAKTTLVINELGTDERPASALAQREFGLRVFFVSDTSAQSGHITIPTIDIASLTVVPGTDLVTLDDGDVMAALVAAMEAAMVYRFANGDEETITVTEAVIVGRNS